MICRAGAASRRAPGPTRSSARWCACRRPCAPAGPIRAGIRPGSAAPTSRRSCTAWRSCPPAGSCRPTLASRPARTPDGDAPARPAPGDPGRDVPAEIMRQICGHLPELEEAVSSRETRIAVELLMDTGRRPAEICTLEWDCLARDADGMPVLVYDNSKAHRLRRRLPVSEHTATLITDQKLAVRERFPATPPDRLKLLPSRRLNPAGSRPVTEDNLIGRHRIWLGSMGPLLRADGTEFDKTLITPYSYRHSYAQRHADAGVPVDVLRELMDHTSMDATKRYFSSRS